MAPVLGAAHHRLRFRPCANGVSLARSSAAIAIVRVMGRSRGPSRRSRKIDLVPSASAAWTHFAAAMACMFRSTNSTGSSHSYRKATRTARSGSDASSGTRSISLHWLAFHTQNIIESAPRSSGSGGGCRQGSDVSFRRDFASLGAGLQFLQRRANPDAGGAACPPACSPVAKESGLTLPGHAGALAMMVSNSSRVL